MCWTLINFTDDWHRYIIIDECTFLMICSKLTNQFFAFNKNTVTLNSIEKSERRRRTNERKIMIRDNLLVRHTFSSKLIFCARLHLRRLAPTSVVFERTIEDESSWPLLIAIGRGFSSPSSVSSSSLNWIDYKIKQCVENKCYSRISD